jgi:hypothetical protein
MPFFFRKITDADHNEGSLTRAAVVKITALVLFVMFSLIGISNFDGSPYIFLLFNASFFAMVSLALPRPRLFSYTFLVILLFLGFWMKLMIYLLFDTAFLEPIGNFDGSPQAWDSAIAYPSMAAIGICLIRALHVFFARRQSVAAGMRASIAAVMPKWYPALCRPLWFASLAILVLLNALNFVVAFYQTGVNPKLILPFHLNVVAAWLINIGIALWLACLAHWEHIRAPQNFPNTLLAPIIEGLLSSVSALSRSFYVMHTVPYFLALVERSGKARNPVPKRAMASLVLLWALVLTLALGTVSLLRINIYYLGYTPTLSVTIPKFQDRQGEITQGATFENQIRPMVQQVTNLFIARWIGLESTLAIAGHKPKSPALLNAALRENPTQGNNSIYQSIANSPYTSSHAFTFLTLPGFVTILAYSGSLLVILLGTALITTLMIGTEIVGQRLTRNPLLLSIAGLGMANVLCQANFPYLTAVFFIQLWVALAFIWGLQTFYSKSDK